jgi:hypothetical protein
MVLRPWEGLEPKGEENKAKRLIFSWLALEGEG